MTKEKKVLSEEQTPSNSNRSTQRWVEVLFPVSVEKQTRAGILALVLAFAGAFLGDLVPVSNLNLLAPLLVGYFLARKIHPHLLVGPAAVALSATGLFWSILIVAGEGDRVDYAAAVAATGFNLFAALLAGSVIRLLVNQLRARK